MIEDPTGLSITEAADAVVSGKLSSVSLTEACLARIQEWQPSRNCFIAIDEDRALAVARERDMELSRGYSRGKLHGIPLAHKDMFYRKGRVTTGGSAILRSTVADTTATVMDRLDAAGAIDLGTLNMSEFAAGPTGHNIHFGDCRNAFNRAHVPGGSSSGSAVATAARLAFGALGSDTGASIRLPAAYNGVIGLKPTYGRVSRYGAVPRSWSLDHVGMFARTAADCALLLQAVAGPDPGDLKASHRAVPQFAPRENELSTLSGLTIGVATWSESVDSEIAAALDDSVKVFERLGAAIKCVSLPDMANVFRVAETIIKCEAAALHRAWLSERPQDYSNSVKFRIEAGFEISAVDYIDALRLRTALTDRFLADTMSGIDILHLPVSPGLPPTVEASNMEHVASETLLALFGRLTQFTRPFNLFGLPAISIPCGFSSDGLPLAYQLVGHPFAEALLLHLAGAYQRQTSFHEVAPKL